MIAYNPIVPNKFPLLGCNLPLKTQKLLGLWYGFFNFFGSGFGSELLLKKIVRERGWGTGSECNSSFFVIRCNTHGIIFPYSNETGAGKSPSLESPTKRTLFTLRIGKISLSDFQIFITFLHKHPIAMILLSFNSAQRALSNDFPKYHLYR